MKRRPPSLQPVRPAPYVKNRNSAERAQVIILRLQSCHMYIYNALTRSETFFPHIFPLRFNQKAIMIETQSAPPTTPPAPVVSVRILLQDHHPSQRAYCQRCHFASFLGFFSSSSTIIDSRRSMCYKSKLLLSPLTFSGLAMAKSG